MEITEVRIKLIAGKNDKLRAFCSITIDNDFVVRDLKIIEGAKGPFVAMPSRKLMERCKYCKGKNHHRARYCNECGRRLPLAGNDRGPRGGAKLHADIAHPINAGCREFVQSRVLEYYAEEIEKAEQPGYRPADLEVFDEDGLADEQAGMADIDPEGLRGAGARDSSEPPGEVAERHSSRQGHGSGYYIEPSGHARGAERPVREFELDSPAPTRAAGGEVPYPGSSRDALAEKRRQWDEVPCEPEDNFGAGLLS